MLYGKTIVVTGVASGIGARTADLAAGFGADVIGIDRVKPADGIANFIAADLGSPAGIRSALSQLPSRIDALCNVAGISGKGGAVATLSVNFYGLRALSEALAPRIREGGAIVNVASIAGFGWRANLNRAISLASVEGFPDVKAVVDEHQIKDAESYPVSKEALLLWTHRAAHHDLFKARGIRVNAVSPGPVETPILGEFRAVLGDERVDSDIARVGRSGTPADIAPVILFLCSDGARWINGANVPADGGLEASVNAEVLRF
ncbi:MAG TPA: coniferyl-alcohol dehydrogenase [Bauldia sp.]|nr:coniferyl-alcohol dehydrogenase [Bauldia sp.]